jgi:hypothetical protein
MEKQMGLRLRYEAHTLPWLLDFKQKVASIPTIPGSGTGQLAVMSTAGRAGVTINLAKFKDRLDKVIAEDEGSLIGVWDGDELLDEWIAKRGSGQINDRATTYPISGPVLASIFDQYLVPAFDGGANPAIDPNWKWGGGTSGGEGGLLANPGFEGVPLPNGGFELGSVGNWQARNTASIRAILNAAEAQEGSYHGEIFNITAAGDGAEISIQGLTPGKTYTIIGYGNDETAAGDRYRAGVTDAITPTHPNAYTGTDGTVYAEIDNATQGNGSSDGTYQSFTLSFIAASDSVLLFVEAPDGAAADLKIDGWTISGYGVGLGPWIPLSTRVNTFEVDTSWSNSGAQSCKIQADDLLYTNPWTGATGYAYLTGIGQDRSFTVGKTHNCGIVVRQTSGSDQYFVVVISRKTIVGEIGSPGSAWLKSAKVLVPSGVPTVVPIDEFVPDVAENRFEIRWQYQGADDANLHPSPDFWVDDAYINEGLPAAYPGDILIKLFDAHSEIGKWIDYSSFTATLDSNGVAFPKKIAFEVQWGEHYGHVLDRMVDVQLEWELVRKTTPVGNLTHDFHLYNKGGRDSTPATAINKGQSVTGGEIVSRIPDYTSVLLEGAGRAWSKVTDATTEGQFGVLEKFVANRQLLNEETRVLAANEYLAYEAANRKAARLAMTASFFHPRPGKDFKPGDSIPWQVPPRLPKETRRVQRIDYTNHFPTRYVVTGSTLLDGEAAAFDLIWRLWRRFSRPQATESAGSGLGDKGGHFTVQVAASDASAESQGKADVGFLCLGVDDHLVIMAAQLICWSAGGGEVWLSEGTFTSDPDEIVVGYSQSYPEPITLHGASNGGTVIQLSAAETAFGVDVTDVGRMVDVKVNGPLGG